MFLIFHNYNSLRGKLPLRELIRQFRYAHCHLLCKEKARKSTSSRQCRAGLFNVAVAVGVLRLPVESVATHIVERLFGFEPD